MPAEGGGGFGGAQPAASDHPGGVPRLARARHGGEDGARAQEVRRERRHGADDRIVDRARPSPRAADSQRARRADRRRRGAAAAAREVLHPRDHSRGAHRHRPIRSRTGWTSGDGDVGREPGVPAAAGGGAQGREAGRVVRQRRRRCAAAGRGASSISIRRSRSSTRRSARAASCCSGRRSLWRAQPHGTFKLFFNGIYYGSAISAPAGVRPTDQP